jgi:hypothetical protein
MIYRAYWKAKTAPAKATPIIGFVKAADPKDARRIMEENLDTTNYEVTDITEAAEHMITPQSITINFRNTSQYTAF